MSKMLDRVARAIYDSTYKALSQKERDEDWDDMKETFMTDARAAVEALKNIDDVMNKEEFNKAMDDHNPSNNPFDGFNVVLEVILAE